MYQINRPKTSSAELVFLVEVPRGLLQCRIVEVCNRPEVSTHIAAEVLRYLCYVNTNCRAVLEGCEEKEYKFVHSDRS
jgi:hypothetical protein